MTPSCVPTAGQDQNCKSSGTGSSGNITDSARLSAPHGCTTSYRVRVSGSNIARVTFKIDGKTVKTVKKSPFSYRLKSYRYGLGAHRLTATTLFKSGKTKLDKVTFQRCAKRAIKPNFTG